jgi:hypothetical protein
MLIMKILTVINIHNTLFKKCNTKWKKNHERLWRIEKEDSILTEE